MSVLEFTGLPCAANECHEPAEVGPLCPAHALARYRRQAVRPTPERWLKNPADVQGTDGGSCQR